VRIERFRRWAAVGMRALVCFGLLLAIMHPGYATAQDESSRKVRSKVAPVYPDLARKMSITGTVKMMIVVGPNGTMKEAKVVGGHPILVNAAMEAVKKWRFEPTSADTTETLEFKFAPE